MSKDYNQESNPMTRKPSEEDENSNHAEPAADIENGRGSAPSQSKGVPGISETVVDGPYYRPLLQATFRGDWESAKIFFEQDPASKKAIITSRSETVLHIAALSGHDQFVENLVDLLSPYPEALEEVDCDGRTALHNAVLCGKIRMVKALVGRNPKLTQLADNEGRVPLGRSAPEASTHKKIAWFLAKNTTDDGPSHPFSGTNWMYSILDLTFAGHHDITLYLVGRYPDLITMKGGQKGDSCILDVLVRMKSHFRSGTRLSVLEALIYKCIPVDLNYIPTDENSDPGFQCLTRLLWNAAKIIEYVERVQELGMGLGPSPGVIDYSRHIIHKIRPQ